jgi:hypothetical protein
LCIGQKLALLEKKVILVRTAREFEIGDKYGEWEGRVGEGWWRGRVFLMSGFRSDSFCGRENGDMMGRGLI